MTDTGVAVLPGSDFGRPPEELTVRLAYVNFDGARALAAVGDPRPGGQLDDAFVEAHCAESVAGVARLCEWLT